MADGKKKRLTRRSRYFSPAFSPDGKRIAVAETDEEERNYLTIISSENGKSLQRFPAGDDRTVQTPAWTGNSAVVFVTVSPRGKQLETLNLEKSNSFTADRSSQATRVVAQQRFRIVAEGFHRV